MQVAEERRLRVVQQARAVRRYAEVREIPLDGEIRETADGGRPIVVSQPQHPLAEAYRQLALTVRDKLAALQGGSVRKFPQIVYS